MNNRTLTMVLFLLPALAIYVGLVLFSFGQTVYYSFFNWDGQTSMHFVGLGNFVTIIRDSEVIAAFLHNVVAVVMAVGIQVGTAIVVAILLSRASWGFATFRGIYFLPVVVSAVAYALMWGMFLNPDFGLVNTLLRAVGLGRWALAWLSNPRTALVSALFPQTVQGIGWNMVILLAAISRVPESLYEAADLEGIRFFQALRYVTVPLIWEAVQICIVVAVLSSLQGFTHIMVLTLGGPNHATNLLGLVMYRTVFAYSDFGYGSSIAVIIVLVGLIFSVVFKRFFSVGELQY
jgi:raffinose/stachyose/melibiose transport system permease protein